MAYSEVYVLCPYFRYREGKTLQCEGPVPDTNIHWCWKSTAAAVEQENIFCRKHYTRCEIYRCIRQNRCEDDD